MKKAILGVLGVILLGALGSGLRELAMKPLLVWAGNPILDVATLGLNSLRDGIYVGAARGSYNRVGLALIGALTGTVVSFTFIALLTVLLVRAWPPPRSP